MILLCLIIFVATLFYFFLAEYVSNYNWLLFLQGVLLFIIAFINLIEINLLGLIIILAETLIVKAFFIPYFLNKLRRSNNLNRVADSEMPVFYSLLLVTVIIITSFITGYSLNNEVIDLKFFTISISTVFGGLLFIIIHKNIFNHIVGFLIIENGAFVLSLAVGSEFPFLVSMAVLIDILIGLLIIGVFVNKVGNVFGDISISNLTELKD